MKKIGILTGGGDAPGLNAVIRSIYKAGKEKKVELYGFKNGFSGIIYNDYILFNEEMGSGLLHKGGTILGTNNRDNPFHFPVETTHGVEYRDLSHLIRGNLHCLGIECLIVVGGDGTLGIARDLHDIVGVPLIGVPKTIDNDLEATDYTFGFETAVQTATESLDKLHTTAESHHRVMVMEVMGRYAGWIALYSGIAGGADVILIPELKWEMEGIIKKIKERKQEGKSFSLIVVAEGTTLPDGNQVIQKHIEGSADPIRLGGIGQRIATWIEEEMKIETRFTVLGHLQRGGSPIAHDRILATRYGIKALELAFNQEYGKMVCLDKGKIRSISLQKATGKMKLVSPTHELVQVAKEIGIYIGKE